MLFLVCITIIQIVAIIQCVYSTQLVRSRSITQGQALFSNGLMLLAAVLITLPIFIEYIAVLLFAKGSSVSMNGNYSVLWFLGIGGALAVLAFGLRLFAVHSFKERPPQFLAQTQTNYMGIAVGFYMLFVVADQIIFYQPPRDDSGMLSWSFMREEGMVKDVHCESSMLVVAGLETGTATYRCPHDGLVVMGRFTGKPIVPWPHYTEGTSQQLAIEVRNLQRRATSIE